MLTSSSCTVLLLFITLINCLIICDTSNHTHVQWPWKALKSVQPLKWFSEESVKCEENCYDKHNYIEA